MRLQFVTLCLALLVSGCAPAPSSSDPSGQPLVSDLAAEQAAGEWILHGLSGGEQRYSALDQINTESVERLGFAFEYSDFVVRGRTHRGTQATPLMQDGILYFTGPWSVVYAVDARTGEELWVYDAEVDGSRARVACCDVVNRGVALSGDRILVGTIDGHLVALDKSTGDPVWKIDTLLDRNAPYTITGAPRLAGDLVVIGNGGAEMGVRGYVTAYRIDTGEQAWRFFTVPSAGADETPDIAFARETWSEDMPWEYGGGGTVWDSMVYDAALDTIYVGVGNASPRPVWKRGGDLSDDGLYLASIVALDASTGRVRWHYQTAPGESWDYTATQHMILADMDWQGEPRQVIMQAPKNGFFYVLDRVTGELLSAEPFADVTWASGVDMATGRPILTEQADYSQEPKVIAPGPGGAHNWPPMSYNPDTGYVYLAIAEYSSRYSIADDDEGYIQGTRNTLDRTTVAIPGQDDALVEGGLPLKLQSRVIAWDPKMGRESWSSDTQPLWGGGTLSTAGGLVFTGSADGALNVFDAATGALLKSIETGTTILAPPMTYELDGEQYVAALASIGGVLLLSPPPGAAFHEYRNYERLLVFKLDGGETPLPDPAPETIQNAIPEGLPTDADTLALGEAKYVRLCSQCHAARGLASGYPDLWNLSPAIDAMFDEIVLNGAMAYAGMSGFSDVLTPADTLAIRAYLAVDRQKVLDGAEAETIDAH